MSAACGYSGREPARKRQRESWPGNDRRSAGSTSPCPSTDYPITSEHYFLPTHLALLRALHEDDIVADDVACSRPSWFEVNGFVRAQASIVKHESQARRTHAVLRTLQVPRVVPVPEAPASLPDAPLTPATARRLRGPHLDEAASSSPQQPIHADPIAGLNGAGTAVGRGKMSPSGADGRRSTLPGAAAVDPRSVVCSVLRRAIREGEGEHRATCARQRVLRRGVDETVRRLGSSLDELASSRADRATPWREPEDEGAEAADVEERQLSKLLLWRKLQGAMSACHVDPDVDLLS
eukprot:jgi/Undpi1/6049/HiC_scaffold_2.g01323.m1